MEDHPDATIQSTPVADKAVLELHDWMFRTYLPMRYPQIYYRQSGADGGLLNGVSNKIIPLSPSSAVEALRALGSNIDTDFLVLMPCSISPDGLPIYHLQAFVTCFPSGFSLRKKLGMPLAEIHTPVPGYKAKLEKSMDRFFARLECGKAVKRSNWGITTVTDLFLEGGTHFHNDKASDGPSSTSTEGDGPSTRTYQYHLEDVKNDGYADELAAAIEGLVMGSVPEMNFYKRGVVWSEAVLQYLRS
ncbi:uncharacterized protein MYCGRDRAFT_85322 [Zymoseptoria tritici IPO323]|uniref:Uncharacterized protein n=1 Tax=Zymoseptoria tritici (strain CBS 115943 / IPO323) TaxID=336722 RepID=F9X7C6_ZYMTI|nr:uncharacterized protein MYCGRDRAFT_85322 [Zymoseptoria tritici IPO323]EGP88933.1 hypothetical protein MYCGRDRAFT_85322 [Zymoseptoria tritici IPO323]